MNKTQIAIERAQTVSDVEGFFSDLDKSGPCPDLLIPRKLHGEQFGGLAALIQFIITWARFNPDARLKVHVQKREDAESHIESLCRKTHHGITALLLAPQVVILNGEVLPSEMINKYAHERLVLMGRPLNYAASGLAGPESLQVGLGRIVFLLAMTRTSRICSS